MRPVDASGDILPVLSAADMATGAEAVAVLAADRLRLLTGDWWENPVVAKVHFVKCCLALKKSRPEQ